MGVVQVASKESSRDGDTTGATHQDAFLGDVENLVPELEGGGLGREDGGRVLDVLRGSQHGCGDWSGKPAGCRSASRAAISQENLRAAGLSRRRRRLIRKATSYRSASQIGCWVRESNRELLGELVAATREESSILHSIERARDEDYRRDELLEPLSLTRSR